MSDKTNSSLGLEVARDTAAARRGVKPEILNNTFGMNPPKGSVFGQGFSDRAGAADAAEKQRNVPVGSYYKSK